MGLKTWGSGLRTWSCGLRTLSFGLRVLGPDPIQHAELAAQDACKHPATSDCFWRPHKQPNMRHTHRKRTSSRQSSAASFVVND